MYNQFCCSVYICLFDALSFSRTRTHNLFCKEIKKKEEGGGDKEEVRGGEGGGAGGFSECYIQVLGPCFFLSFFFFGERSFFS